MKIVLIWASNNEEKYGNKILKDLLLKWHKIIPVNNRELEIYWLKSFGDLSYVKENYDIVCFVVKPEITSEIIKNNKNLLKNKKIWIQPWAWDIELFNYLKENNYDFEFQNCIMKTL